MATLPSTPTHNRLSSSHLSHASPHYTTTRRHSLYGVEDRIIIDPGSRIWKVGFSGEGRPRDVVYGSGSADLELYNLQRASDPAERAEEERLLEVRLESRLRSVFHKSLLTDPKARKVILIEHPLLPLYIKEMLARILFENLQVPSVSFASSHLLSLFTVGRITGLVLDCGHLESVALPIFASRPLYPQLRTTPLAGSRLTTHLRNLILLFGTYLPPPTSLSSAVNVPAANRAVRVPEDILTTAVVEDIKARCCFVGSSMAAHAADLRDPTPASSEADEPSFHRSDSGISRESGFSRESGMQSESDFSHLSSTRESEDFSVVSLPRAGGEGREGGGNGGGNNLQQLAALYTRHSSATDIRLPVTPPAAQNTGTGMGLLVVPGWVRERAAEVLFEGGDVDESSVAEVILDALLMVPIDLRKTLISSILITGGTAMLPGFIPRLHSELLRAMAPPLVSHDRPRRGKGKAPPPPPYDPYGVLRPLIPHVAILNNPSPPRDGNRNAGRAPAFTPATMAWVGGSLAGSLKTGGSEVAREKWDENQDAAADDSMQISSPGPNVSVNKPRGSPGRTLLPDWTTSPLPMGAPPVVNIAANRPQPPAEAQPASMQVGA